MLLSVHKFGALLFNDLAAPLMDVPKAVNLGLQRPHTLLQCSVPHLHAAARQIQDPKRGGMRQNVNRLWDLVPLGLSLGSGVQLELTTENRSIRPRGTMFCGSTSTMLARTGVSFQAAWGQTSQHDGFQLPSIRGCAEVDKTFLCPEHTESHMAQWIRRRAVDHAVSSVRAAWFSQRVERTSNHHLVRVRKCAEPLVDLPQLWR